MALRVYAIVPRDTRLGVPASAWRPRLRIVRGRAAAAVVANGRRAPAVTPAALRSHDRIVRRIAAAVPALLPVRFGTVFECDQDVVEALGRTHGWRSALRAVAHREQMTLRVFQTAGTARPMPPPTRRPRSGTAYLRQRAASLVDARRAPELDPLRRAFRSIVVGERIKRHDRDTLALTAYHLIKRGAAADYRRVLEAESARLGVRILASGPWPPYAFAPEIGQ